LRNILGVACLQSGDLSGAEDSFGKAVELDGAHPAVWLHYGEVLCARSEWHRGAEALERGMRGASGEYRILCQSKLALALTNSGRPAAGERAWRRVLRRQPDNILAWNGLATT
jgi:cytochrome c-type biogenesis protein CcmH/NrfG